MRYHPIGALNDFFPVKQLLEEANTAYKFLGPVVQKVDSGIHWRDKSLPEDKAIGLRNTYTLERGLSAGQRYPPFVSVNAARISTRQRRSNILTSSCLLLRLRIFK